MSESFGECHDHISNTADTFDGEPTDMKISQIPVVAKAVKKTAKAPRYNYFVGLKLSSSDLTFAVTNVKAALELKNPVYKKIFTPTEKMHLTLNLIALENEEDVEAAKSCLGSLQEEWKAAIQACSQKVNNVSVISDETTVTSRPGLHFKELGSFGKSVLWAGPEPSPVLQAVHDMATRVHQKFVLAGLKHAEVSKTLHATLAKTNMKTGRLIKIKKEDYELLTLEGSTPTASAEAHLSGETAVNPSTSNGVTVEIDAVDLMKIGSTDNRTGYYQSIAGITLYGESHASLAKIEQEVSGGRATTDRPAVDPTSESAHEFNPVITCDTDTDKGLGAFRTKRPRHNFYVGLKLESPTLSAALIRLREELEEKNPHYSKIFYTPEKLHLTLLYVTLTTEESVRKARECLLDSQNEWKEALDSADLTSVNSGLRFSGLDSFRQDVLWTGPEASPMRDVVMTIAASIHAKFIAAGLENSELSIPLHATLAKTNFRTRKMIKIKQADYKNITLGATSPTPASTSTAREEISVFVVPDAIDLLRIGSIDPTTGYYQSVAGIRGRSALQH
jgi:2'-5' RNA ligase